MLFKELIDQLKKIKQPEQLTEELANEMIMAGISSYMSVVMNKDENIDTIEAMDKARLTTFHMFDDILLDLHSDQDDFLAEQMRESEFSPMNDPQFKKDMEKVIEAYNKRVTK